MRILAKSQSSEYEMAPLVRKTLAVADVNSTEARATYSAAAVGKESDVGNTLDIQPDLLI